MEIKGTDKEISLLLSVPFIWYPPRTKHSYLYPFYEKRENKIKIGRRFNIK